MCGIFGVIGKDLSWDKFSLLAVLNEDRGTHATGIYDSISIVKDTQCARHLLMDIVTPPSNVPYIVGHTRFATHGSHKNKDYAHPFEIGDIIGAHNGIISNLDELEKDTKIKYPVDSMYIFKLLSDSNGDYISALKKPIGSFALWFVNKNDPSKLYLFRHTSPLGITRDKNRTIYFSSDTNDLYTTLGADAKVFEIPEDTLYTIDLATNKISTQVVEGIRKIEVKKPKRSIKSESYTAPYTCHGRGWTDYGSDYDYTYFNDRYDLTKDYDDIYVDRCAVCNEEIPLTDKPYCIGSELVCETCLFQISQDFITGVYPDDNIEILDIKDSKRYADITA